MSRIPIFLVCSQPYPSMLMPASSGSPEQTPAQTRYPEHLEIISHFRWELEEQEHEVRIRESDQKQLRIAWVEVLADEEYKQQKHQQENEYSEQEDADQFILESQLTPWLLPVVHSASPLLEQHRPGPNTVDKCHSNILVQIKTLLWILLTFRLHLRDSSFGPVYRF